MPNKNKRYLSETPTPVYEEDWSDKLEPYASSIGLAGDAIGLGAALTGIGAPVGAGIAGVANIPNIIIDGYQTLRDAYRAYNDGGANLSSALWNGGELILDAAGLKFLSSINKAKTAGVATRQALTSNEKKAASAYNRVGTGAGRVMARRSANRKHLYNADRLQALKKSTEYLRKRGVRSPQGEYFHKKLADEMAKRGYGVAVNDAIKSTERTIRQNLGIASGISGGQNIYHINNDLWKR